MPQISNEKAFEANIHGKITWPQRMPETYLSKHQHKQPKSAALSKINLLVFCVQKQEKTRNECRNIQLN